MLTKEPEMLQTDAIFGEHTTQQNATAAGALPKQRFSRLSSWF